MDEAAFDQLIQTLSDSPARIEAVVRAVPAARWEEVIHTGDGAWSRRQLLAHIAANDLRQLIRVRIGAGVPRPGDPEAHAEELGEGWNQARVDERASRTIEELLAEMRTNRESLVSLLGGLTPAQRARPMPFRGVPTPLEEMVPVLIGHLESHAAELAAATSQ